MLVSLQVVSATGCILRFSVIYYFFISISPSTRFITFNLRRVSDETLISVTFGDLKMLISVLTACTSSLLSNSFLINCDATSWTHNYQLPYTYCSHLHKMSCILFDAIVYCLSIQMFFLYMFYYVHVIFMFVLYYFMVQAYLFYAMLCAFITLQFSKFDLLS